MEFHIHIHNHNDDQHQIITKLNSIMGSLQQIQDQNTALMAAVAAEDTVIDSAVTLITGFGATLAALQQQLADAIANGVNQADVQAVADSMGATVADITAKKDALAAAVSANTPTA
jgi:uncharacterized spore protein YtfJ